jgi:NCS1 family nucleobase:cation symporter-1
MHLPILLLNDKLTATGFNAAQMQTASSAVALGLNPGLAVAACLVGNLLVTPPVVIIGYLGAKTGLNFPVLARATFGMWGSYFALLIRGVFCLILYGVINSLGGGAVRCMLEAIWPSFATWHAHSLPASASITAPDLLCFALFWLASFPFLLISISNLRWVFTVKIVLMPFFYVALFTWALTSAHGVGPLFSIPSNISGGYSVGYVFCATTLATIGANATFAVNMADITRYARQPRAAAAAQAFCLPVFITLTELLGALLAASSQVVYGQVLWNPLTIILLWDNRPAKFFAGLLFGFAMLATNISGNSVPFANDITAAFPKYMNIRRGQVFCAIIGFASNPWIIQAKASTFFNFIGSYSTFLGPLVGG